LNEQAAKSAEEAKRVQSFIEQSQKAEAAAQEVLKSLRGQVTVLSKDLAQAAYQCKRAQSANEATQQKLNILRGDGGALRTDLGQALSQCKQVQLAQEAMLQRLEEQSQKTEANAFKLNRAETSLQDTREALHVVTLPTFIYSYKYKTNQLHRTKLVTGEQSSHQVPSYTFMEGCCWSEVPGGSLLITGGGDPMAVSEVVRIDVGTFEVSRLRDMHTPRRRHAAVHHTQHLYVLGGRNDRDLSECERYVCAENRWQGLPPLPRACYDLSGVVVESSLYAPGGFATGEHRDLVQKLSLESVTWELMQFRLPFAGTSIPCFKLMDIEVYLVVNQTLCSFTGLEVRPLKSLTNGIYSLYGASYYRRGTLYCSSSEGAVRSNEIGSLSN
jgi:hypothetical protein